MQHVFDKLEHYIYTRYAGEHLDLDSVIGWVSAFIDHPDFRVGCNVLWDATGITGTNLSFGDMEAFGEFLQTVRERRGGGRSAFVAHNDLIFGLFRTHEMLNAGKFDYDYKVFRGLDVARQWITVA